MIVTFIISKKNLEVFSHSRPPPLSPISIRTTLSKSHSSTILNERMQDVYTAVPLFSTRGGTSSSSMQQSERISFRDIKPLLKYIAIGILLATPIPFIIYGVYTMHHTNGNGHGNGHGHGFESDISVVAPIQEAPKEGRRLNGLRGAGALDNIIIIHEIIVIEEPRRLDTVASESWDHMSRSSEELFNTAVPAMEHEMMEMMNSMAAFMADALVEMDTMENLFAGSLSGFERTESQSEGSLGLQEEEKKGLENIPAVVGPNQSVEVL
jgi:hypothetical protein